MVMKIRLSDFLLLLIAYTWPPGEKPDFINATDDASMRDLKK